MTSGYGRPLSPPRTNRYHPPAGPPGRTSAGSFFTSSAYDPYAALPRTSREYVSGPRSSDERIAAPRLLPPRARSPPRRSSLDDYDVPLRVRPRHQAPEPETLRTRRPLSMIAPSMAGPSSPTRITRPIITSAIARPPSPTVKSRQDRRDEDYEVLPATSASRRHHQRHSSLNTTDPGRLMILDKEAKEKSYRVSGSNRPPVRERQGENDRDYGFEYTEGREPKLQDPAYRQRSRGDSFNTNRPKSTIVDNSYISRSERGSGPPVTSRGFEKIGRSESLRQQPRAKDEERVPKDYVRDERDISLRNPARPEITLHQSPIEGYPAYPEDDSRHHRSRKSTSGDDRLETKIRPRKQTEEDDRLEPNLRPRKLTLEEDDRLGSKAHPRKPTSEEDRLGSKARDVHDDRSGEDRPRRHRHKHHRRDHDHHREDDEADGRERRVRDELWAKRDNPDNGGSSSGLLAGAAAATAGAGLAAEEVRRHRHRDRELPDDHKDKGPRDDFRERDTRLDQRDRDRRDGDRVSQPRVDLRDRDPREEADLPPKVDLRDRDPREEGDFRPKVDLRDRHPREEGDIRPARRPQDHLREYGRDHLDTESVSTSLSTSEREDAEYQEAREASRRAKEQAEAFVGPVEPIVREQRSFERRPEDETPRHHRTYRPHRHHSSTQHEDSWSETSSSSSSDSDDDGYHRPPPRVVTPANDERFEPKPAPKGILRKPREQFPEYPATVREGVAPHKDDKKKDVPPNARWTKIDRRLVNPEALAQDGIRFNEFVDHVIVLKVMDREEIEKYTQKTAEIRANRRLLTGPETYASLPPPSDQSFAEPGVVERGVRF